MKQDAYRSAQIVATKEGRQYHIGCAPGDIAPNILLCGDPARAHRVAALFESAREPILSREYVTITGTHEGLPMTVMATGMGADNTEIAFIEIAQIVKHPTLIRIGSSGSLQKKIDLADLVISTGAVRLENTSTHYVPEGYPAVAHPEVIMALLESARSRNIPHHAGLTATASGFYGAQARDVPGFIPREKELPEKLASMQVLNMEMETSCLFTLASYAGIRAGAVCAIYANRCADRFVDGEQKDLAEKRCIETGLAAFSVLARMDQARGNERYWTPSIGFGSA